MEVLVDSSIWIAYFKDESSADKLDFLIDENLVVINEIISTELIPFLQLKKQFKLIQSLMAIRQLPLSIDWLIIRQIQYQCLKNGINGVGIPDLIIAQNAQQNDCQLFSLDKHFSLIRGIVGIAVYI